MRTYFISDCPEVSQPRYVGIALLVVEEELEFEFWSDEVVVLELLFMQAGFLGLVANRC